MHFLDVAKLLFLLANILVETSSSPLYQEPRPGRLFSEPSVFITLSSEAGSDGEGLWHDTEVELNWYNFQHDEGDWVGLFADPPSADITPLVSVTVENETISAKGYFKTEIRFGRPNITSVDDVDNDNCLGYYIAYFRANNTLVNQNCFRKYPRWMGNLKNEIGNTPLSNVMIPGTHDAGAIREYDGIGSENPVVRYSVTQEEQLYRQFIMGIRYVDIRVSYYPATTEKFWINHGTVRFGPLYTLFDAIKRFTDETNEIIFMDFHGFPVGFDGADSIQIHELLVNFVLEHIGNYLVRETEVPNNPTANDIWQKNRTVILTYDNYEINSQHDFLWPYLTHAWGDKNEVEPLEEYFAYEAIPSHGCRGYWWSAMAELTPTPSDVILYPLRGLRGFAQMVNLPVTYWWQREEWYTKTNIVSTDFFLGNNIIEMSMKVNKNNVICSSVKGV